MINTRVKLLQVVSASLWCLGSAGIIFGFAAFKIILIQEGVYSDRCVIDQTVPSKEACIAQDLKLNDMFTISAALTNLMALPVGYILDRVGPRISGILGSICLFLGSCFFIMANSWYPTIDPYLMGYIMFAMGGPFVFISCFQLANSFPKRSGTILAVLTGSFDTSSALFLGYRLIYQSLPHGLSLRKFFTIYLIVPVFILICQCTFMPHESYKTMGTIAKIAEEGLDENGQLIEGDDGTNIVSDDSERASLINNNAIETGRNMIGGDSTLHRRKSVLETYMENKLEHKTGGMFGILHGEDAWSQIKSPWFILMFIFASIAMVRINYFIATVRSQEEYLLGDIELAIKLNGIFDVLLPVGGVISIPFIGMILDHLKPLTTLSILSIMSVTIGIFGLIPRSFAANLFGIILLVLYRPFYYTVVSDYCSKVFGFDTFGTVYGLLTCLCGLFTLTQSLMDKWTHTTFQMNPTPINIVLLVITTVSCTSLIGYINHQLNIAGPKKNNPNENDNVHSEYNTL
ncbi:hypothetical protein MOUN0_I01640 [Monosporozyma unispora]|nr:Protein fmp42 [Kazachstania unispora]